MSEYTGYNSEKVRVFRNYDPRVASGTSEDRAVGLVVKIDRWTALSLKEAHEVAEALTAVVDNYTALVEIHKSKLPTLAGTVIKFPMSVPFLLTDSGDWVYGSRSLRISSEDIIERWGKYEMTILYAPA